MKPEMVESFGVTPARMAELFAPAVDRFGALVQLTPEGLAIPPEGRPLTRMVAAMFDAYGMSKAGHSSAV